ncbi:UNVERIFIED_CONTAM: hypothetical protein Sradi_2087900 [Sesamum radiatum]|uniref:Uncharacterized protein n=1 Tax=Sesamum radiatum TaxID=300843 RepID=A0AAW2TLF5_SESRA
MQATVWNVRGLNRQDRQVAVGDLGLEFSPDNLIWLAWDDDEIRVEILNVNLQLIHRRVFVRRMLLMSLVSIVYGANDLGTKRDLWQLMGELASSIMDEQWMVLGDFITVLDMSEVCGASGDIRAAMEDSQNCILDAGLIKLPMHGKLFTWHNYSDNNWICVSC